MLIINIHSNSAYPSGALSNFAAHTFQFDGVTVASMEGFLQSLKTSVIEKQRQICCLTGKAAKCAGAELRWKRTLFWNGRCYDRYSKEYAYLIECAYRAMLHNQDFSSALACTKGKILLHTIGKWRRSKTVLTWWEFCGLLMRLRKELL